ncbi:MAG: prolyl oligopeptidase family serine peptidase [Bacteroidia bacterium]|nr:prolyl oligopeptidase family serine peptidase [Bacteroidia bacterium]
MKKIICTTWIAMILCMIHPLFTYATNDLIITENGGTYTAVIEGFDWGPAVNKVILSLDEPVNSVDWKDFTVFAERKTDCVTLPTDQASGNRRVIHAYVSDAKGTKAIEDKYISLVLAVAPNMPLSSPIQYARNEKCSGNNWIDYKMTISAKSSGKVWNKERDRIIPLIDRFDLSGKYKHKETQSLSYASYVPDSPKEKMPLIIWLHGGGEGGTDPSIPLIANRAANYASDEIQVLLGGAYVLVPQSPTYWMDNGIGGMTTGKENDMYNEALMALIRDYMIKNPNIDQNRIYLGGCSNGGYMTLKLLLLYPDFFAAAFPSALAYQSEYISDKQIESIKHVPIWFVHAKDDSVTVAKNSVVPLYKRLIAAGAKNVHFSFYDHVVDITGFFGGENFHYNGHWSWIYSHANKCQRDYNGMPVKLNGRPVTIMEWIAAQRLSKN